MSAVVIQVALAADALLPQRDLLLDVEEVARRLSTLLGACGPIRIDHCEQLRVKYRVGDHLRVLYRIRVGESLYTIAARAFAGGRSREAYRRAAASAVPCRPLLSLAHDHELDAVFWTFPNDRKIRNLPALLAPPATLSQLCERTWVQSRLVAYAPEKCATAQCLDEHSEIVAYAKVYAGEDGQRSYHIHNALRQNVQTCAPHLRIPRPLGYSAAYRMLLLEPITGRRIADLKGADLRNGFRHLGAALAVLHRLPPPEGVPVFKRLEVSSLRQAARIIGRACPDVERPTAQLADELCARWDQPRAPLVCLHGDVHPKNGILQNDGVTLIDLDQVAAGPAAADVGSLLAALHYYRLAGLLSNTAARELADTFLAGYAAIRQLPDQTSLRWHTAAALLAERALRAVTRIRLEGLERLGELLRDAEALLIGLECGSPHGVRACR